MAVRFTEFLSFFEKNVCLYFIQEDDGQGGYHFKVNIIGGINNETILCTTIEDHWKNITQNVPQWVKEIKPAIISIIERKVDLLHSNRA